MTRQLFSCGANGYRTPAQRAGAVAHRVRATAGRGPGAKDTWDANDHQAATALAAGMGRDGFGWKAAHWTGQLDPTFCRSHWTFAGATWLDVFHSIVADEWTPAGGGRTVEEGLSDALTASTRFRLVTFRCPDPAGTGTVAGLLAAVVDGDKLHVFDPEVGLHEYPVTGVGADAPANAFRARMAARYGTSEHAIEATTYVLDVLDAFFSYFGPPKTTTVAGQWPDIRGPVSLASAQVQPGMATPRIKLGVLPAHLAAFRARLRAQAPQFADRIEVFSIPSVFGQWPMPRSRGDQIEVAVADVLSQCTANLADIRGLVTAKNLWSLWCLYRYGGYHLDTGVVSPNGQIALPRPGRFAAQIVPDGNGNPSVGDAFHRHGRFGITGIPCVTVSGPLASLTAAWDKAGFDTAVSVDKLTSQYFKLDAPVLRSARGDHGAGVAVRIFLDGWIRIRTAHDELERLGRGDRGPVQMWNAAGQQGYESTFGRLPAERELIVAALCAGVNHGPPTSRTCGVRASARGDTALWIADLGLRKTGAQSHRILTDANGNLLNGPWTTQAPAGHQAVAPPVGGGHG